MTEPYAPSKRANRVADWIETKCLASGRALGADALFEAGKVHGYKSADVDLGLRTMARRSAAVGEAYPFRVAAGAAAREHASRSVWSALLLMGSEGPLRRSLDVAVAAAHLERITAAASRFLLGPDTQSVRFGWPSEDGRPVEFPDAVRWLAGLMKVPVGTSYRPPVNKDGGVDVVAWRPFPDGRSGFPVVLVQCTLERNYAHKAADVDRRVWSGWLRLDVDPTTALAVPDVVAAGEDWNALATRTVVLDRIRLASLLPAVNEDDRLVPVADWAEDQLEQLRSQI